ncbi:phosphate signaling complex protein PhoU [Sandaracinobacteroides hominis]|uniref:phosphate signaling complex protein PhoU n=1 Tax=Sandaracinobacteroides hominis TaxID=2780086 RepID=UPI0018F5F5D0|nr:phosphate signaling complex protein PhoU [Sandaracinobacteroides hominis]
MASQELPHTVTSFDDDLHRLRSLVVQMGALAHAQVSAAIEALANMDDSAATAVAASDALIDRLQIEAELTAASIFSRHAPQASDLHAVMAALRIVSALERVGDYAKNIARRVALIVALGEAVPPDELEPLGEMSRTLLRDAMAAFLDRDMDLAADVIHGDEAVDSEYYRTFRALVRKTEVEPEHAEATAHLQFIAKNFERIADQATNISEQLQFARSGSFPMDRNPAKEI